MSNEKLLINNPKSNNFEDMSNKQIESTDWLTRDIPKEQLERKKQEAIMSSDLEYCHTEFSGDHGEIYTDYDATAKKMFAKGYRKQSEGEWRSEIVKRCDWKGKKQQYYQPNSCSLCHEPVAKRTPFCPNCGAKMKGKSNYDTY